MCVVSVWVEGCVVKHVPLGGSTGLNISPPCFVWPHLIRVCRMCPLYRAGEAGLF